MNRAQLRESSRRSGPHILNRDLAPVSPRVQVAHAPLARSPERVACFPPPHYPCRTSRCRLFEDNQAV
jgi:hypothetical protein